MRPHAILASALFLTGCALEPTPFDGRYRGSITLTRDMHGTLCPPTLDQTLTVMNGRAALPIIPSNGWVAHGVVDRRGVITPMLPPNVSLNARIEGDRATGTLTNEVCNYRFVLDRQRS